jgi:hypothetical protein
MEYKMSQVIDLRTRDSLSDARVAEPYLLFTNPGTLEIELVKLLGVSVKEGTDPIGFFGTGLKYALAAAMRLGGSMTIITGGKEYEVGGQKITLRDKEFTQVTLDGEPLGFTTELGKQWEAWMVVRELYSNALDEGGETVASERELSDMAHESNTVIALRGQCFVDVWNERGRYFLALDRERPIVRSEYLDVYLGKGRTVFYRGIKIHETQIPMLYKYNLIEKVTLTEDRTLKHSFTFDNLMEQAIVTSTDRDFIMRLLTAGELMYEGRLDFDMFCPPDLSDVFKAVCDDLLERMPENANKAALRFYQKQTNTERPMVPAILTRVQQMQLDRAISFVRGLGCDYLDMYPIHMVKWLGQGQHGLAKEGKIYLAADCFDRGTKYVASTLFEEYVHCHHGFSDESRQLQTWLFDRVITMGEEASGEPL